MKNGFRWDGKAKLSQNLDETSMIIKWFKKARWHNSKTKSLRRQDGPSIKMDTPYERGYWWLMHTWVSWLNFLPTDFFFLLASIEIRRLYSIAVRQCEISCLNSLLPYPSSLPTVQGLQWTTQHMLPDHRWMTTHYSHTGNKKLRIQQIIFVRSSKMGS